MRRIQSAGVMAILSLCAACAPPEEPVAVTQVFADKCGYCHSLEESSGGAGPHLSNLMGREAGSVPGFPYSNALPASDIRWTEETLDSYLKDSQAHVTGTTMFVALSEDERARLIAFLSQ